MVAWAAQVSLWCRFVFANREGTKNSTKKGTENIFKGVRKAQTT